MKRLIITALAVLALVAALAGGVLAQDDFETSAVGNWIGPVKVASVYSEPGNPCLFVRTSTSRTFSISADNPVVQSLAQTAFLSGDDVWYVKEGDAWTALSVGRAPF